MEDCGKGHRRRLLRLPEGQYRVDSLHWSCDDASAFIQISDEEIERGCQQTGNWVKKFAAQYQRTLFIRGDNTLAKAAALGHLDSRKLYDDIPYPDVEEVARNHYRSGFVLEYRVPEELLFDVFETVA